jgi:hypothetical protein
VSEWYEKPYPGGPLVKVKGFPRPLFPPDASEQGKKPSVDGPDVEAYKRTVSRAGRWPWQDFDQAYNNGFAHGNSPNVADTGVAGIQRQQKIDDTGWLGKTTFNVLRSIRIPVGLPNAGEMAMDRTSVTLINSAWEKFTGSEPDKIDTSSRREALKRAISQIGVEENPPDSNRCKYSQWYGMIGPWCAMFVTWCYETTGNHPSFAQGSKYAYVPYIVGDARANRNGLTTTDNPIPGDLVCFDWQGDTIHDHIGFFEKWLPGGGDFNTIEGNTSYANQSNGGQVMRRTRNRTQTRCVFVRVSEP